MTRRCSLALYNLEVFAHGPTRLKGYFHVTRRRWGLVLGVTAQIWRLRRLGGVRGSRACNLAPRRAPTCAAINTGPKNSTFDDRSKFDRKTIDLGDVEADVVNPGRHWPMLWRFGPSLCEVGASFRAKFNKFRAASADFGTMSADAQTHMFPVKPCAPQPRLSTPDMLCRRRSAAR